MARVISDAMKNAIELQSGIRSAAKLTLFKNRNYFSDFDNDAFAPDFAQAAGIHSYPIPQAVTCDSDREKLYNAFVNPITEYIEITSGSGIVSVASTSGSYMSSGSPIFTSGSPISVPKWHKFGMDFPYLYYINTSGSLMVSEFDYTLLNVEFTSGSLECVSSGSLIEDLGPNFYGGLVAIGDLEFVMIFIDDGGIGVSHYNGTSGSWVKNTYEHRFMIPDRVLSCNEDSGYLLNYFAAVKRSDGIWIYISFPAGDVRGIHLNNDGVWSDIFVAIPKDLSVFKIGNAFIDSRERIHMTGQFQRVDEYGAFSSDSVWNLLVHSDDGKVFTLDRNTLFSLTGYRFHTLLVGKNMYFVDTNRWVMVSAPYSVVYEDAESIIIRREILDCDGTPEMGYTIRLTSNNDDLLSESLLKEGNVAKLEIGVNTSGSGVEFITWDTCILSKVQIELRNGLRALTLEILSDAMYRLQLFTYPFYLEMQGKQSIYDPIKDMSNLYKAPDSPGLIEKFSIDFWKNEDKFSNGGFYYSFHNTSGSEIIMTGDIKDYLYLTEYPEVKELPLTVKLFGWDATGTPCPAPEPWTETTPPSNNNDDITAVITVIHEDGTEDTYTTKVEDCITAPYFPQTYVPGNDRAETGAYPVIYHVGEADGLVIGDKIKDVGIKFESAYATVYYPERIEIPNLEMSIDPSSLPQDSFEVVDIPDYDEVYKEDIVYTFDTDFDTWTPSQYVIYLLSTYNDPGNWYELIDGHVEFIRGSYYGGGSLSKTFNDLYDLPGAVLSFDWGYKIRDYWEIFGFYQNNVMIVSIVYEDGTRSEHWLYPHNYMVPVGNIWHWCIGTEIPMSGSRKRITRIVFDFGIFGIVGGCNRAGIDNIKLTGFFGVINENNFVDSERKLGLEIKNVGIPNIYFSSKPYSAFNFEESCKMRIEGEFASAGLIGIAENGTNFICARVMGNVVEIVKVREGKTVVLTSGSILNDDTYLRLMFTHKNGDFYVRKQTDLTWSEPILTYRWKYDDGPIATDNDLFHVGLYSINDVPKFRICSFNVNNGGYIGLLPGYDETKLDDFPDSGKVVIDNVTYNYGSKISGSYIKGPFQVRACSAWDYSHPADGEKYAGVSIEMASLEWLHNPTYHNKYHGQIFASNAGYNYIINETDHKPWIVTNGEIVYLNNRGRFFLNDLSAEEIVSCMDKAYVTIGLGNVTATEEGTGYIHQEGAYCYKDVDCLIAFTDFYASSDDQDTTIKDLIHKISALTGAKALFPGDTVIDSLALNNDEPEDLL